VRAEDGAGAGHLDVLHRLPTPDVANDSTAPGVAIAFATAADAVAITAVRNAAAEDLTRRYGRGHWSGAATERGVLYGMRPPARVLIARAAERIVGTLRLATKKPWAIDTAYFGRVRRPLYLLDMAVDPQCQRRRIGTALVEEAKMVARAWPADSLRLDAYDSPAGAGPFYEKCAFREVGRVRYREVPLVYYQWMTPLDGAAVERARS
jgi:GNAT superfamily N-acetyltransferase